MNEDPESCVFKPLSCLLSGREFRGPTWQADDHIAEKQKRSQQAGAVHENSPALSGSLIDRITRCADAVHSDNGHCRPNSPYRL